jgi:peptide-methionine (S)-S-oxide reductase
MILDFIDLVNTSLRWKNDVVTSIEKFESFWQAEDEHQDYLQRYPAGYTCHYVR